MSSASADVALDTGTDESAEALCEGGSCNGNHGFTRGAPLEDDTKGTSGRFH
ncbi:MAG: hypothetical protein JW896_13585 [Deltaproteobacteria bacterium]|nr:hypothetical protein [Deltaproteobacteria bacterium]